MTDPEEHSYMYFVTLTSAQRRWTRFIQVTGLREVLFFLDCSVPLTRGRLHRLHRLHSPGIPRR